MATIAELNQAYDSNKSPRTGASAGGSTPTKPTSSGRFFNLQSYLKAQQPGQGMAGSMAGKMEKQGQGIQAETAKAKDQFQSGIQGFKSQLGATGDVAKQIQEDPTKVDTAQAEKLRDVQYLGPQQAQGYAGIQQKAQQLGEQAKMTGSEQGRFQLLRQMFNKPTYTTGQQRLDQALLQTGGKDPVTGKSQLDVLKGTQNIAQQTGRQVAQAGRDARAGVTEAQGAAQAARSQIRGTLDTEAQKFQKTMEDRLASTVATRGTEYADLQKRLNEGTYNPEDLGILGLQSGQRLFGIGKDQLSGYLQRGVDPTSAEQVLKQEDITRINALQKMAGGTAGEAASKAYGQLGGRTEQTLNPLATGKTAELAGELQSRQSAYQGALTPQQVAEKEATSELDRIMNVDNPGAQYLLKDPSMVERANWLLQKYQGATPEAAKEMGLDPTDEHLYRLHLARNQEESKLAQARQMIGDIEKQYGGVV